jgi:hypothetical protein
MIEERGFQSKNFKSKGINSLWDAQIWFSEFSADHRILKSSFPTVFRHPVVTSENPNFKLRIMKKTRGYTESQIRVPELNEIRKTKFGRPTGI